MLRPGGRLVVCAWLGRTEPRPWRSPLAARADLPRGPAARHGRRGRLPDARHRGRASRSPVSRTSAAGPADLGDLRARRLGGKLATQPRTRRYLLDPGAAEPRLRAHPASRLLLAYRTGAMRYGAVSVRAAACAGARAAINRPLGNARLLRVGVMLKSRLSIGSGRAKAELTSVRILKHMTSRIARYFRSGLSANNG